MGAPRRGPETEGTTNQPAVTGVEASPAIVTGAADAVPVVDKTRVEEEAVRARRRLGVDHAVSEEAGDKPAQAASVEKSTETAKTVIEEIPDNKWSRYYYDLKERTDKNPNLKGALTDLMLSMLLMAAKYSHYADMVPGRFRSSLDEDEHLKAKRLDKKQEKAVLEGKGKDEATNLTDLAKLAEEQQKAGRKLGIERASTRFATNALWGKDGGFDDINDASTLAASLLHTSRQTEEKTVALYTDSSIEELRNKSEIERGTIIIFIPDPQSGQKVVAYADNKNKDGKMVFKYYDPAGQKDDDGKTKNLIEFSLTDPDCPVKSGMGVPMVLIPNVTEYAKAPETAAEPEAADAKPDTEAVAEAKSDAEPKMPALDTQIKIVEGANAVLKHRVNDLQSLIDRWKINPASVDASILENEIGLAAAREKDAEEIVRNGNVTLEAANKSFTEAELNENRIMTGADGQDITEEARRLRDEAGRKTNEARRIRDSFKSNLDNLKALLPQIRQQSVDLRNMKK